MGKEYDMDYKSYKGTDLVCKPKEVEEIRGNYDGVIVKGV